MPHALVSRSGTRDWTSEKEIAAVLSGRLHPPTDPASFAYTAVRHQVAPLLIRAGVSSVLPPVSARRLLDESRRQAVLTELRERELRIVLRALHDDGLRVLLIKGANLSGSCYPESYLRVRDDTDLLIRPGDALRVAATLSRLGYERQTIQTSDVVLGQMMFDRPGAVGAALDVHCRIASSHAAAAAFDFDELMAGAVALPRLGPHALGLGPADALVLACVHQVAHHAGHDLMLWMYDVHLLIESFDDVQLETFVAMAVRRRLARMCAAAIENAAASFPSVRAELLLARLRGAAGDEPGAAMVEGRRPIDGLLSDLSVLDTWRGRAALVLAHLFPSAAYMRTTCPPSSRAPLAWLYLRRIARGAGKWTRSNGTN
jgi:hypothetical protein